MNYQDTVNRFEPIRVYNSRKSMTVPDMSYTPREIIQKFSRGERVPLGFKGLYDDDDASPFEEDPTRDPNFDFGDYVETKHALNERMKEREKRSNGKVDATSKREASAEESSVSEAMKRETTSVEVQQPSSGQ